MGKKRQTALGQPRCADVDEAALAPTCVSSCRQRWVAAALIVAAGLVAYANCYKGKFVYDGVDAVQKNTCIRTLWPLSQAMSLPLTTTGTTVDGRPILSLSFALNHAIFGPSLSAYHAVNVAIHICAALLLFGLVKRTLDRCQVSGTRCREEKGSRPSPPHATRDTRHALSLATAVALLWVVHPLQTESVTYLAQRAESLMGLFYLVTLYAAIRGFQVSGFRPQVSRFWFALSIAACALGMGTKEVMISAPLAVLAYDYVFVCGSFRKIFRRRWGLYAGLVATWGVTALLLARGGLSNIGEDYQSRSALWYALTQPRIILYYLRLSAWPHPLVMDYNWPAVSSVTQMLPEGLLIAALLALTAWALWRRKAFGFAGLCFFFVLAPTSSFFPTSQSCHEHRMYLPLAVVLVFVVTLAAHVLRRIVANPRMRTAAGSGIVLILVTAFTARTLQRNRDYHDVSGFWAQNASDRPGSPVAQTNVGVAMYEEARRTGDMRYYKHAIDRFRAAIESVPRHYSALNHWGVVLFDLGKTSEAMAMYSRALKIMPNYDAALDNMGNAHSRLGQFDQAVACYRKALKNAPRSPSVHSNLGGAYLRLGQLDEAVSCFREALEYDPANVEALNNLGTGLHRKGQSEEAVECYRRSLELKPARAKTHRNMALILGDMGRYDQAIACCLRADALRPDNPTTQLLLGQLHACRGDRAEATQHCRRALTLAQATQNGPLADEIRGVLRQIGKP